MSRCKDRRPLTEAERSAVAQWLPLLWKQAGRFRWATAEDREDAEQEAVLAGVISVHTHKPERAKLCTHMGSAASFTMQTFAKKLARRGHSGPYLDTLRDTIDAVPTVAELDHLPEAVQPVVDAVDSADVEELRAVLRVLPDREYAVIAYRWLGGLTLKETGQFMGVTSERVRQIEAAAFVRLREFFGVAG